MSTIITLLAEVAAAVGGVGKDQKVTSGPAKFNFRGIDAVVNAVAGPMHARGVIVTPTVTSCDLSTFTTGKGSAMNRAQVIVTYTFFGPDGDNVSATVPGEAFDSGDKATSKAMSVAFRTALLQTLTLPTDDPDPDATTYDAQPVPELDLTGFPPEFVATLNVAQLRDYAGQSLGHHAATVSATEKRHAEWAALEVGA